MPVSSASARLRRRFVELVRDRAEDAVVVEAGLADRDDPLVARPVDDLRPAGVIDLGRVVRVDADRGVQPGETLDEVERATARGDVPARDEDPLHAGQAGRAEDLVRVALEAVGVEVAVGVDQAHRGEGEPAQLVAQPLVVEHEFPDLVRELGALPLALQATSRLALVFGRGRSRCPDRVGRGTQLVGRHMADRRGLAGSVRGMPCCSTQVPGRGVCMAGRRAGLRPRDLTPRPGTPEVDRPTRTVVRRPRLLEVVQHVLRAVSRPHREKAMIVVLEAPAATHGDEPADPGPWGGSPVADLEVRPSGRLGRLRSRGAGRAARARSHGRAPPPGRPSELVEERRPAVAVGRVG